MSETQTEPEAPPEEEQDEAPEVDLPDGWVLVHYDPGGTVVTSETQGESRIVAPVFRAEKSINGILVNAQGESPEALVAACEAIDANVASFETEPVGAAEEEIAPAMRATLDEEGNVAEEEIPAEQNQAETVITEDGRFTEAQWAGRENTDTVLIPGEEGTTSLSGIGESAAAIDEARAASAQASAEAENEATKDAYAGPTQQVTYDTADRIDSPGQSAGGTLVVPEGVETLEDAAAAMNETSQAAEVEKVTGAAEPSEGETIAGMEAQMQEVEATDAAAAKAEELGVDLSMVEGTGADGRILVSDVEAAAARE